MRISPQLHSRAFYRNSTLIAPQMPGLFAEVWPPTFDLAIQNEHFKGRLPLQQVCIHAAFFLVFPPADFKKREKSIKIANGL